MEATGLVWTVANGFATGLASPLDFAFVRFEIESAPPFWLLQALWNRGQPSSRFRHVRPGYIKYPWSRVTHSQPCSIASVAWNASGIRLPLWWR